jgi:endonuclease/exonuclease/phosphatase family metal-dependent hydrolase
MTKITAALLLLCAQARAQVAVNWNGDAFADLKAGVSATPAPAAPPAAMKAPLSAGSFSPEPVSDPSAFALTKEDVASAGAAVPALSSPLGAKLESIFRRVYVSAPETPSAPAAPGVLRVISWNAADPRGSEIEGVAALLEGDENSLPKTGDRIRRELSETAAGDVFLVQEIGLPAAITVARRLGAHLVWAPEFVEVGPKTADRDPAAGDDFTGNAILSRYPLSDVRVLRFAKQGDWYRDEKKPTPLPEKGKRLAGEKLFAADVHNHETRLPAPYGGRMALLARVAAPYRTGTGSGASIAVADIHLESKAKPELRRKQMDEVIAAVKGSADPVVFGGDLNTLGGDGRQLTFGGLLIDQVNTPGKVVKQGISIGLNFSPVSEPAWAYDGYKLYAWTKSKEDPTSIMNPEHRLFGDVKKQLGVKPLNERDTIGYKHTWSTGSPKQITARVLDWLFLYDPSGALAVSSAGTYEKLVNGSAANKRTRVSDHFPVRADIPLR